MVSHNDITGDAIQSKSNSDNFRKNYDKIFGKSKLEIKADLEQLRSGQLNKFIQNVSFSDIENGTHFYPGANTVLIQITDKDLGFPEPKYGFKLTTQYVFADVENNKDIEALGAGITTKQAKDIISDLQWAKDNNCNVIVHCVAGVCRSGAVVEIGVIMGFSDPETFRAPNLMVKHALMKVLGIYYE